MDRKEFISKTFTGIAGLILAPIVMKGASLEDEELINQESARYDSWVQHALSKSKEENVILVNKSKYTLDVLRDEKIIRQYPVELGFNPVDDKQREGDGCTPEGIYTASLKLPVGQTAFYKAILIDYPTKENWKQFSRLKASGTIPKDATIGGAVEIHGMGSGQKGNDGGRNWTLGCVALSNKDIDILYESVRVGTPIIIVRYTSKMYK